MTTTKTISVQAVLNQGNLNETADALRLMKAGYAMSPIKAVFSGLSSAATQDITTAAAKAAATITGITLGTGENLPPIGYIKSCRPTTGSAGGLARVQTDKDCAPTTTNVVLSDDGKSLTFEAAVTGIILEYYPAPAVDMTSNFAPET